MTRKDGTGHDKMGQDTIGRAMTLWDTKGSVQDGIGQDTTGRDRTGQGCFKWLEFNSFVGFSIVLCMYVKLYYLLVTDLTEKSHMLAIPTTLCCIGRKELERLVGNLCSIHLAFPGASAHLYHIQRNFLQGEDDRAWILTYFDI